MIHIDGNIAALGAGILGTAMQTLLTVGDRKAVVVQNITLVNNDTADRTCNIYINVNGTRRRISPKDLTCKKNEKVVDDDGYTLQAGDLIEADAATASVIEWSLSGIEKVQ